MYNNEKYWVTLALSGLSMSTHLGNAGHCGRFAYITDRTSVACWEAMPVKMILGGARRWLSEPRGSGSEDLGVGGRANLIEERV